MTKPNIDRETLWQLLTDARTQHRWSRLQEACGINSIPPILQRLAKTTPRLRVLDLLNAVLLLVYGITFEAHDDHAFATELFQHMVVEDNDVDGFIAAMERMLVIRRQTYA